MYHTVVFDHRCFLFLWINEKNPGSGHKIWTQIMWFIDNRDQWSPFKMHRTMRIQKSFELSRTKFLQVCTYYCIVLFVLDDWQSSSLTTKRFIMLRLSTSTSIKAQGRGPHSLLPLLGRRWLVLSWHNPIILPYEQNHHHSHTIVLVNIIYLTYCILLS